MDLGLKNAEGYYDLTAFQAIRNVIAEEKRKKAILPSRNTQDSEMEKIFHDIKL